jgi:hypothetical protein
MNLAASAKSSELYADAKGKSCPVCRSGELDRGAKNPTGVSSGKLTFLNFYTDIKFRFVALPELTLVWGSISGRHPEA